MKPRIPRRFALIAVALAMISAGGYGLVAAENAPSSPKRGDMAPDFTLKTLDDHSVRLKELLSHGPVVLLVLRGWPGYQCPICTKQVQDYISSAPGFTEAKAQVIMVYPGPAPDLKAHAQDFLKDKQWPKEFLFVIDPDYTMINAYGLRWDAPSETSYPSTFVIDNKGTVRFVKISHTHGGRTSASEVLAEMKHLP